MSSSKHLSEPPTDSHFEKANFVPPHEGPEVLPSDLIFHSILQSALLNDSVAIRDENTGQVATRKQFISDVVGFRNHIKECLSPDTLQALREEEEISFMIWSAGYEFAVAFFAVQALGGVAVPLSPHITVEEAAHCAYVVRAHAALTSAPYIPLASQVQARSQPSVKNFKVISSTPWLMKPQMDIRKLTFNAVRVLDQNKAAAVIFTSGSTGPPKGVALRRYHFCSTALMMAKQQGIDKNSTIVQFMPTHHLLGLQVNTIPSLLGGGCVEFSKGGFDAARVWNRFRKGGIPLFSAVPTIYVRLLAHWDSYISKLPVEERSSYQKAISSIGAFHSSAAAMPLEVARRWTEITGKPILERYGGTEQGNVYYTPAGLKVPLGSVGIKNPSVESKLSEGNRGEVLVRGPYVLMKYMHDLEATKAAFDKDGWYKTGDIAREENGFYFIEGRSSVDILKSGGYKISALDVEQAILRHPKVSEAIVVGVDDDDFGQRIAAAIVLRDSSDTLTLSELRADLRSRLSNYKLPTLLRVVPALPKTASFKVPKKLLKAELFESNHRDVQRWMPPKKSAKL